MWGDRLLKSNENKLIKTFKSPKLVWYDSDL